ncbi:MAG: hypothetical protein JOZ47_05935 [Kutzneria sp.]|nr:hypothetical protein [Kutzneria sp.]
MGRVVSVQRAVGFGLYPVGALFSGWVVSRFGVTDMFLIAGGIQGLVWLITWLSPLSRATATADQDDNGQPTPVTTTTATTSSDDQESVPR